MTIVLGHGQIPTSVLYLSSEENLISSCVDCPRIFSHPQIGHWVWPLLTQLVYMRSDIGSGLFQRGLSAGYNWSPQQVTYKNFSFKLTYLVKRMLLRLSVLLFSLQVLDIVLFPPNLYLFFSSFGCSVNSLNLNGVHSNYPYLLFIHFQKEMIKIL